MANMNVFFQITKVDEEKRTVIGRAVDETPDRADEVFDYATSKPLFEAWSEECHKDSGGKSLGNVRSMHGNVAAGKLVAIDFDDVAKAIDVAAKVVDDNEWQKVLEGVHTGFSIGGKYAKKWQDGALTRYTAAPNEISLVDRPCVPTAKFFDVMKTDGTVRKVHFRNQPGADDMTTNQQGAAVTVDELTDKMADLLKGGGLSESEMLDAILKAHAEKESDAAVFGKKDYTDDERDKMAESGEAMPDGRFPIKNGTDLENAVQAYGRAKDKSKAKAHIEARAKALDMEDKLPADWGDGADKADAAGEVRKDDVGAAGSMAGYEGGVGGATNPYGSSDPKDAVNAQASVTEHPVPSVGAMVSFKWGETDVQGTIKELSGDHAMIEAQGGKFSVATSQMSFRDGQGQTGTPEWAAAGVMEGWPSEKADKPLLRGRVLKAAHAALKKGMYGVSSLACLLEEVMWLQQSTEWEAEWEGDGSTLPDQLKAWLATGGQILTAMVQEEVAEMTAGEDDDSMMALADRTGALTKRAELSLAFAAKLRKYGARHSAADFDKVQGIHDHAAALGAMCKSDNCGDALDSIINAPIDDYQDGPNADFMDDLMMADKTGTLKKRYVAALAKHDASREVGAAGDLVKAQGELEKVSGECATLRKRVAELEALPKAGAPALKSMDKAQDANPSGTKQTVDPVKKSDGTVDDAATMFKSIHQNGPMIIRP